MLIAFLDIDWADLIREFRLFEEQRHLGRVGSWVEIKLNHAKVSSREWRIPLGSKKQKYKKNRVVVNYRLHVI